MRRTPKPRRRGSEKTSNRGWVPFLRHRNGVYALLKSIEEKLTVLLVHAYVD